MSGFKARRRLKWHTRIGEGEQGFTGLTRASRTSARAALRLARPLLPCRWCLSRPSSQSPTSLRSSILRSQYCNQVHTPTPYLRRREGEGAIMRTDEADSRRLTAARDARVNSFAGERDATSGRDVVEGHIESRGAHHPVNMPRCAIYLHDTRLIFSFSSIPDLFPISLSSYIGVDRSLLKDAHAVAVSFLVGER